MIKVRENTNNKIITFLILKTTQKKVISKQNKTQQQQNPTYCTNTRARLATPSLAVIKLLRKNLKIDQ